MSNPIDVNNISQILEEGAKEAYSRPWFRLERGLRMNRLRLFVVENFTSETCKINPCLNSQEVEQVISYLTRALDKKLLNTAKIVEYEHNSQRILTIKGFEVRRQIDGTIRCGFLKKRPETMKKTAAKSHQTGTRRAKPDIQVQTATTLLSDQ